MHPLICYVKKIPNRSQKIYAPFLCYIKFQKKRKVYPDLTLSIGFIALEKAIRIMVKDVFNKKKNREHQEVFKQQILIFSTRHETH